MAEVLKMRFLVRSRTAAEWTTLNEVLLASTEGTGAREMGVEEDTGRYKLGDGVTAWNDLPYQYEGPVKGNGIEIDNTNPRKPVISSQLGKVDMTGVAAGKILRRDPTNGKWIPSDETGGGGGGAAIDTLANQVTLLPGVIPIPTGKLELLTTAVDGVNYAIPAYRYDPNDHYIDNVVAMTFFDGPDGSTTVTDAIGGLPWNTMNGPTIDATVQPFLGVNSLKVIKTQPVYIDLTGALIGDQDYTIECMVNLSTTATFDAWWRLIILTDLEGGQGDLQLSNNSTSNPPNMRGVINTNGTIMWSSSGDISRGNWHHIEYSRKGNTYRYFRDGTLAASYATSTAHNFTRPILAFNGTPKVTAGTSGNGAEGNYAMLRVTVGVARHDANFTPPWGRYQLT